MSLQYDAMIYLKKIPVRAVALALIALSLILTGCANRRAAAVPDYPVANLQGRNFSADWTGYLPTLLSPMLRCVEAVPGSGKRVVRLWPMNAGMAGARIVNAQRQTHDCVAAIEGEAVDRLELRGHNLPRQARDGRQLFTPVSGRPPEGQCYRHENLEAGNDGLLGWLSYDLCLVGSNSHALSF